MDNDARRGTAVVFPGMAPSPYTDVARFMLVNPFARKLLGVAEEVLGYDLLERFRADPDDYSEYAQVAFLVNSVALARMSEDAVGARPDVCVGASFGGKAAAVHSGALGFADAVRMTAQMTRYETRYFAEHHTDIVTQSFARTPREQLDVIMAELTELGEWHDISCHIDDDFWMLSLRDGMVDWIKERLRALGGMPIYTMKPPMHSSAFGGLKDLIEENVFPELTFRDPDLPVLADQDGRSLETAADVRTMLLDGYVRPVVWPAVVDTLKELGVGTVRVAGPDSLFGRVPRTTRNFEVLRLTPDTAMRPVTARRRPRSVPA
ncbi:ACP S-malonyltransferase [Streptomyces sp. NPDC002181]|uniref:ACP S-malonyltransferase n=1 Tax=Streptomyces sp. NPDC002181 TaxID=3364635 RepID=UPI0036B060CE